MNEDALTYRLQRGLDQMDEQMALLVQRVSGSYRGRYFFPDLAGVGISYNTFAWKDDMDPKAGMLRLVFGLGTRAVNRVENDYPRIVALDAPLLKPHAGLGDTRKYSQHEVDVIDIEGNSLETVPLAMAINEKTQLNLELLAVRDLEASEHLRNRGMKDRDVWILTFDRLLAESPFPTLMQHMLKELEKTYHYPVDIEFTTNFSGLNGSFQINLLQCRPLQTKGEVQKVTIPSGIDSTRILFQSRGNFMGSNVVQPIKRIIFVDPEGYSGLPMTEKYDVARVIGKLNKQKGGRDLAPTLLMGPGRWGTTTPSLGVPVRFSEINHISVMVEIEYMSGSLVPELSFGTHFFQDLVETDIFYVAIFPGREDVVFNGDWLEGKQNSLGTLLPESRRYEDVVKVHNVENETIYLMADIVSQRVICFSSSKTDQ